MAQLIKALEDAEIDLCSWGEADFDEGARAVSAPGCAIPDLVGEDFAALGLGPISVMKLEDAVRARKELSTLAAGRGTNPGVYTVVELTFCENGCVREPDL